MTASPVRQKSLQSLLSRFHFGITLFAVALSGLTVIFAGTTALRGYADRNLEMAAHLGTYSVEPALVFNDPVAARTALEPLTKVPGIKRLEVLNDHGQRFAVWQKQQADPAPFITRLFFPRAFEAAIARNGSVVGTIRVWGDSTTLLAYLRTGLFVGFACLLITAIGTILIARRFEYELVKPLNEIAGVAHAVREHRRFDQRVKTLPIVELDRLGSDINALLDELQGWQGHMESEHARLSHRALHDRLTGLPNRAAFDERLESAIGDAERAGQSFALLYMDADRLKDANDRYGHAAGDALLKGLSARIQTLLRSSDFVARLGGDEFAILLRPLSSPAQAHALAERLSDLASKSMTLLDRHEFQPGVSIGIAFYPYDGDSAGKLLSRADSAMYAEKQKKQRQKDL